MSSNIVDNSEKILDYSPLIGDLTISFKESIIILSLAFFAGLIIRSLYLRFANSFSSKAAYGNTLLMVTVCVASLIAVVKSSLALSLGLVGALSVIRFRTAVKEPYTLSFILLSVCIGIAIGANQYKFALLVGIMGTIISLFTNRKTIQNKRNSKIHNEIDTLSIEAETHNDILNVLSKNSEFLKTYTIKTLNCNPNSSCNATVGVHVENNDELNVLIENISNQPGITNVTFYNSPI